MTTKLILAGCFVAGGLMVGGCERNEPVGQSGQTDTTYANPDRGGASSVDAANKEAIIRDSEQQLTQISDDMHRWMEQASKSALTGGEQVANNYREARDKMEKAAEKARKELQELRQASGDNISQERKEFNDALAELRQAMAEGKQKVNLNGAQPGQQPLNQQPGQQAPNLQQQPAQQPGQQPNVPSPTPNDQPGQPNR